jgi:hypothetical protein
VSGVARAGLQVQPVIDRAHDLWHTARRYHEAGGVPALSVGLFVHVEVRTEVVKVDRCPQPEKLKRERRRSGFALATGRTPWTDARARKAHPR